MFLLATVSTVDNNLTDIMLHPTGSRLRSPSYTALGPHSDTKSIQYPLLLLLLSPVYLSELLHVYTPSRTLRSSSGTRMLKIQLLDPTSGIHSHIGIHCSTLSSFKSETENVPLLTVFSSQLISVPSCCYSHCVCVCVCVCVCAVSYTHLTLPTRSTV